jgi:hypothetical protein
MSRHLSIDAYRCLDFSTETSSGDTIEKNSSPTPADMMQGSLDPNGSVYRNAFAGEREAIGVPSMLRFLDTQGCGLSEDVADLRFEVGVESIAAQTKLVLVYIPSRWGTA